jgi:hypothetical protein
MRCCGREKAAATPPALILMKHWYARSTERRYGACMTDAHRSAGVNAIACPGCVPRMRTRGVHHRSARDRWDQPGLAARRCDQRTLGPPPQRNPCGACQAPRRGQCALHYITVKKSRLIPRSSRARHMVRPAVYFTSSFQLKRHRAQHLGRTQAEAPGRQDAERGQLPPDLLTPPPARAWQGEGLRAHAPWD